MGLGYFEAWFNLVVDSVILEVQDHARPWVVSSCSLKTLDVVCTGLHFYSFLGCLLATGHARWSSGETSALEWQRSSIRIQPQWLICLTHLAQVYSA